ncbi:TetR family transcriptional regulator [Actinomadura sp. LD22]|uniref:TetR family transcriptional regulator n=1 Tax=Actinomadura physcomitrii TaxID=2650748 RepID=A0A6I4M057_9ACTN|nr:TetR/AcrR family transcriptional regulator [Actinomadura physcomitrii]MVZ99102.1 TetR family transcriptional regulator [Actinomadura physcomitrii]
MARWEPNARERLVRAAIDLFAEQGYDATTVTGIAERAGLTKTTFFRYFPDKREVLFAGQELHSRTLAEAVAAAPGTATPLQAVAAALDALAATFTDGRRAFAARLLAVIDANDELRERAAFKHHQLAAATAAALRERGAPDPAAGLAAELGVRAFDAAFARWSDPSEPRTLAELAHEELDELRSALAVLD